MGLGYRKRLDAHSPVIPMELPMPLIIVETMAMCDCEYTQRGHGTEPRTREIPEVSD